MMVPPMVEQRQVYTILKHPYYDTRYCINCLYYLFI